LVLVKIVFSGDGRRSCEDGLADHLTGIRESHFLISVLHVSYAGAIVHS
jgi:hypothetical protein